MPVVIMNSCGYKMSLFKMISTAVLFTSLFNVVWAEPLNRKSSTNKMIIGMALGFAFIVGLAVFIVALWCCCCGNGCSGNMAAVKRRVAPSEPNTRSTSAESTRS